MRRLVAILALYASTAWAQAPASPAPAGAAIPGHAGHAGHGGQQGAASAGSKRAPAPALNASVAADAKGVLWAVRKDGEHVVVHHSADRGQTWSAPQRVNPVPEAVAADGDNRPKVATGREGAIYVSWTSPRAKPYTGDIRFARSIDGGASFASPVTVHADRQEITHRFDSLAVDAAGRVFVTWIDKRDQEIAKAAKRPYRGAAIYAAVSADRGASFGGDRRVAEHSCECCRIGIAPRPEGGVTLLWRHVFEPNVRDHALADLDADAMPGTLVRATIDDWRIDACPHHGPSLVRDGRGRLHGVWFTQGAGREGIHYGRLAPDGQAVRIDAPRRVGGPAAAHADLAVDGDRVAVVWKEFDGKRTRLLALRSDDGGNTWREASLTATEGPSGQPQVLAAGGEFLAFWPTATDPLSVTVLP
jgi:hypothetical protein